MLNIVFPLYLSFTLLLCFFRIKYGIAMYLLYMILVPYINFFSLGQNFFPIIIIVALLLNYGVKGILYKPLIPFLYLYIAQFLLIPLHNDLPIFSQINFFRTDFMNTLLLPLAIINTIKQDRSAIFLYLKVLIFTILIAASYSVFLSTMPGINPYLLAVLPLGGGEFKDTYALAEDGGRVFGRISGVFPHPMTNGLFLSLSFVFISLQIFIVKSKTIRYFYIFSLFVVFIAIFFIGVRTAIVSTAFGLIAFVLLRRKFELALYSSIGIAILLLILSYIPGMEDFVVSIFSSDSSNVKGSSMDMRITQLEGAFYLVRSNPLFGLGYNWTQNYITVHGEHPILLAFESLIYMVLCNNGFAGLAIWIVMLYLYYKKVKRSFKFSFSTYLLVLMIVYILYTLVTGDYGYMKFLLIFYSIMWMQGKHVSFNSRCSINKDF